MKVDSTWAARLRSGLRFFLVALVAKLFAALALLPPTARWIAPLGFLLPGRGVRALVVSFLLDVPLVLVVAPAAWLLGRIGEGSPTRRAILLVVVLWALDALSGLFVNENFDRWMDAWSGAARVLAMVAAWALARKVLQQAARQPRAAPPRP